MGNVQTSRRLKCSKKLEVDMNVHFTSDIWAKSCIMDPESPESTYQDRQKQFKGKLVELMDDGWYIEPDNDTESMSGCLTWVKNQDILEYREFLKNREKRAKSREKRAKSRKKRAKSRKKQ